VHTEASIHRLLTALAAKPASLQVSVSMLFGAPGETLATVDYATRWIKEYADAGIVFYYNVGLRIYPGTRLFCDWQQGRLDRRMCFGPGLADGGLSPVVYCAAGPPRVLTGRIAQALVDCANARRLAAYRSAAFDESLRLVHVAAANWHRGDVASAATAVRDLGIGITRDSQAMEAALRLEQDLRTPTA
jgi:hypothetical protein